MGQEYGLAGRPASAGRQSAVAKRPSPPHGLQFLTIFFVQKPGGVGLILQIASNTGQEAVLRKEIAKYAVETATHR
jgi:hypothetical protein